MEFIAWTYLDFRAHWIDTIFLNLLFQAVEIDDGVPTSTSNNKTTHKEQVIHIDHESFYEGKISN